MTLDADAGVLAVVGGATASVRPAAASSSSPVRTPTPCSSARPTGLLSVDLESGDVTTVSDRLAASAVEPVRLGACVVRRLVGRPRAPWPCSAARRRSRRTTSAATPPASRSGSTAARSCSTTPTAAPSGTSTSRTSRSASTTGTPSRRRRRTRTTTRRTRTRPTPTADRREAKPDSYGVRAGRTTVLHPLDNDSAPEGRLLSIVDVDQPSGGARVEISPDGQTLVLQMPEDARPARFDYFIDDGRNGLSAHAAVDVAVRGAEQNEPPDAAGGLEEADLQGAARRRARGPGARGLARRPRRRHPAPRLREGRGRGGDRSAPPARRPTAGSGSPLRPVAPTAPRWCAWSSPSPTVVPARSRSR